MARHKRYPTLLSVLLLVAACASPEAPRPETAPAASTSPSPVVRAQASPRGDDLFIVDCLLPPRIVKEGRLATRIVPGPLTRTSASDCEVRGGKYVTDSLPLWMKLAEEGNVTAQVRVGEILDKGQGGAAPDYKQAAEWYRRAAQSGSSSAAVNLGALYEKGLGVPKDAAQAVTWYRRAAGSDVRIDIVAPGTSSAETEALRRQLEDTRAELDRTKRELDSTRQSLEQLRTGAEADRAELARLRQQLQAQLATKPAEAEKIGDLKQAIANLESQLAAKGRESAGLKEALDRKQVQAKSQEEAARRIDTEIKQQGAGPKIVLIEPELIVTRDITVNRDTNALRVSADTESVSLVGRVDADAGVLSFTINGRQEKLDKANMFKTQLPIRKADEPVRIAAVDRVGGKATLEFVILNRGDAPTPSPTNLVGHRLRDANDRLRFGTYYALLIGNNDYSKMPPLRTAINDAQELKGVLETEYGFRRVVLLTNATRYKILSELENLRLQLTDKDNLLIYYAGHGWRESTTQRGYWVPVDAEANIRANMISTIDVSDILSTMTVKQLLVVADSCYSGAMTRSAVGRLEGGKTEEELLKQVWALAQGKSRMALTSGGLEPVIDGNGTHSVFAGPFIELLRENVGVLPAQELFDRLRPQVAAAAAAMEMRQVPEHAIIKGAGHESGDFVFIRVR